MLQTGKKYSCEITFVLTDKDRLETSGKCEKASDNKFFHLSVGGKVMYH